MNRLRLLFVISLISGSYSQLTKFNAFDSLMVDEKFFGISNDSNMYSSPHFTDWDDDGLTDIIMGIWNSWEIQPGMGGSTGGKIKFIKNSGVLGMPQWTDMGYISDQSGKPITPVAA